MPGLTIPNGVSVKYGDPPNSFIFPVALEPVSVSTAMDYDPSGRVVTGLRHLIRLSCIIYPDASRGDLTAGEQITRIKQQLSQPGAELVVEGTGFGAEGLVVNRQGGGTFDQKWGPHPTVIDCQQVGSNLAWKLTWQVETVVAQCPNDAEPGKTRPLSWTYTVAYDVDSRGLTRRTVSGQVTIPLTRRRPDAADVADSADRLREAVKNLAVPPGFRRVPGLSSLSADRRTLEFSLTDEQLENQHAPPPGIISVNARHEVNNAAQANFIRLIHTLTASYVSARDTPKGGAWVHFYELYVERRKRAKVAGYHILPLTLSCSEGIYDTTSSYTLRYAVTSQAPPPRAGGAGRGAAAAAQALRRGELVARLPFMAGLWTVPPSSDWQAWHDSLENGAFESRGYAKLKYDPADGSDSLVTVCQPPGRKLTALTPGGGRDLKPPPPGDELLRRIRVLSEEEERPSPDASFLHYRLRLRILPLDENVVLKLLPEAGKPVRYRPQSGNLSETKGFEFDEYNRPARPPHVVQFRAHPTYVAQFEGEAVRYGYAITPPSILDVGGARAIPWNRDGGDHFGTEILSGLVMPVVVGTWRRSYLLETTPAGAVLPPENPTFGGGVTRDDGLDGYTLSTGGRGGRQ